MERSDYAANREKQTAEEKSYFFLYHHQIIYRSDIAFNMPYPWNLVLLIFTLCCFFFLFVKKFLQIDIKKYRQALQKAGDIDIKNHVFVISNVRCDADIYRKKCKSLLVQKNILWDKLLNVFVWIMYIGYFIAPTLPFVLRGVWHNKPLSVLALLCSLFFVFMVSYMTQLFYAKYRVYRQVEKELGMPLEPICPT